MYKFVNLKQLKNLCVLPFVKDRFLQFRHLVDASTGGHWDLHLQLSLSPPLRNDLHQPLKPEEEVDAAEDDQRSPEVLVLVVAIVSAAAAAQQLAVVGAGGRRQVESLRNEVKEGRADGAAHCQPLQDGDQHLVGGVREEGQHAHSGQGAEGDDGDEEQRKAPDGARRGGVLGARGHLAPVDALLLLQLKEHQRTEAGDGLREGGIRCGGEADQSG